MAAARNAAGSSDPDATTFAVPSERGSASSVAAEDSVSASVSLEALNPEQREAVTHRGGPCLVLAGAGSGKTRVITHRIAWLIGHEDGPPDSICALTFTNKAAAEMRGRVASLLGEQPRGLWVMTFHALGLRLLRDHAGAPGAPPPGFAVYDRDDSLALWTRCQKRLGIDLREYRPRDLFGRCSHAVNRLEDPSAWDAPSTGWERRVAARVFSAYRQAKAEAGAVDFDDLLLRPLELLSRNPDIRQGLAERFRHLLVDEYQDTNRLQYRLIKTLLAAHEDGAAELMVVGDEDQSIYRWRGAELANVLEFQRDFPGATVIRLERNYRSTQPILDAAGSLVAHNRERLGKELWTEETAGEPPLFVECGSERQEARWVVDRIEALLAGGTDHSGGAAAHADPGATEAPASASEIAVLYRTNAQSRSFEEELARRGVPYVIVGGARFFERREVRDILAYLRLLVRPDEAAFRRAVSTPSRGVGPVTLETLASAAPADGATGAEAGSDLVSAFERLTGSDDPEEALRGAGCPPQAVSGLVSFRRLLDGLRALADEVPLPGLIFETIERSGYGAWLADEPDGADRREVLAELASAAADVENPERPAGLEGLAGFLDRLTLLTDADASAGREGAVRLMSVHAAKGLEFHTVFLVGMEEGLFPHASALADGQLEEERRLCYVGMTRARRRLFLTAARLRRIHGQERAQEPSRFVSEIDPRLITKWEDPELAASVPTAGARRGGGDSGTSIRELAERRSPRPRSRRADGTADGGVTANGRAGRDPGDPRSGGEAAGKPASEEDLRAGVRVLHPKFGHGEIVERQGSGERLKLTVRFRRAGTKRLLARYAGLRLAGS